MKLEKRQIWMWIRSLHIYLSLAAFMLLFFFTLTGWLMVHEEAFGLNQPTTRIEQHPLTPPDLTLNSAAGQAMLDALGLKGRLMECEADYAQFTAPGRATWVELDRQKGIMLVTHETRGMLGKWFDVHRNRHTAWLGTLIQDLTAALFLMISLSGILLWLPLSRRRRLGIVMLMCGSVGLLIFVW